MSKEIEYASIKYFTLLRLQTQLKSRSFEQLDLNNFEKLKNEVNLLVEQIDYKQKHKNDCSECDGTGIIDNSYMTCLGCKGTGKLTPPQTTGNK